MVAIMFISCYHSRNIYFRYFADINNQSNFWCCRFKKHSICSHWSSGPRILFSTEGWRMACLCLYFVRLPSDKRIRGSPQSQNFTGCLGENTRVNRAPIWRLEQAHRRRGSAVPFWTERRMTTWFYPGRNFAIGELFHQSSTLGNKIND